MKTVKRIWSFGFLSWLWTYIFIINYVLNENVYILEIVLEILEKLIHDSRNVCVCLTLNEIHTELASLIICLINGSLTNTPSTHRPKVIYIYIYIYIYIVNLIIFCTSTETFIYWKLKHKIFNLFWAPNQHNFCAAVLWKFLPV